MSKTLIKNTIFFLILFGFSFNYSAWAAVATLPEQNGIYVTKAGDTLYSIGWQFGLDYRVIAAMNNLQSPYTLVSGQHLLLVEKGHTAPAGLGNPPVIIKHLTAAQQQQYTQASNTAALPESAALAKEKPDNESLIWIWPTTGKVIKSYSINTADVNKGIDIGGKKGQPIKAAASGEVVYSGNGIPGYGNLIILKQNADYLTAYAHNEKLLVKEGQTVKQGQQIAQMGIGNFASPQLHFEIRYRGQPVNPIDYLPKYK